MGRKTKDTKKPESKKDCRKHRTSLSQYLLNGSFAGNRHARPLLDSRFGANQSYATYAKPNTATVGKLHEGAMGMTAATPLPKLGAQDF